MKSAEEWAHADPFYKILVAHGLNNYPVVYDYIKQIQLDAWKQGMSDALAIVDKNHTHWFDSGHVCDDIVKDLKESRDSKTTLP